MSEEKEPSKIEQLIKDLLVATECINDMQPRIDQLEKEVAEIKEELETLKQEIW